MKKIKYLLFGLLILLGLDTVQAETLSCEQINATKNLIADPDNFVGVTGYKFYDGKGGGVFFDTYKLSYNGATYYAFCRNAGKCPAGINGTNGCKVENWGASDPYLSSNQNFTCNSVLLDPSVEKSESGDIVIDSYNAGIVSIIEQLKTKEESNENITYALTALRVYEMLWLFNNSNSSDPSDKDAITVRNTRNYVNKTLDDTEFKSKISELESIFDDKVGNANYFRTAKFETGVINLSPDFVSEEVAKTISVDEFYNNIKPYIQSAFAASKYVAQKGYAKIKFYDRQESTPTTRTDDEYTYTTVKYSHVIEAKNFKSDTANISAVFNCPSCDNNPDNITYKITVNEKDTIEKTKEKFDLTKHLNNGSGTIYLILEITLKHHSTASWKFDYDFDISYIDETIDTQVFSAKDADCSGCQEFYVLYAKKTPNDPLKEKLTGSFTVSPNDDPCNESHPDYDPNWEEKGWVDACTECDERHPDYNPNWQEEGLDSACERPNATTQCTTYINNASCSEDDSNIYVNEGYEVTGTSCTDMDKNDLNVLECIIDNKDIAGNTYQAEDLISDNKYCSVWCKEDYHFTLPGVKAVNSGRYFTLQASIKGTKSCYTSEIDKNNEFDNDLDEARKEVIDAFNTWSEYNAIVNASWQNIEKIGGTYKNGYTYSSTCKRTNEDGEEEEYSCTKCSYYSTEHDCYTEKASKSGTYLTYNYNGASTIIPFNLSFGSVTVRSNQCGNGTCSKLSYSEDYNNKNYPSLLSAATTKLDNAIQKYRNIINEYNSCSGTNITKYNSNVLDVVTKNATGWAMDYNYDPEISFWYEESYMNNVLTNKLTTNGQITVFDPIQKVCTSSVDDSYELCSAVSSSSPSNNWETSNNDTIRQFVCSKTRTGTYSCGYRNITISKAKYAKQEINIIGKYVTPTQFYNIYPTGAIVAAKAGKENEILNSSQLDNGLPVGLGTKRGVYNYALQISNLGEYYDRDELGRIWGSSDSTVVNVLNSSNSCTSDGDLMSSVTVDDTTLSNGVYVCAYEVNLDACIPDDPTSPGFNQTWYNLWGNGCKRPTSGPGDPDDPDDPGDPGDPDDPGDPGDPDDPGDPGDPDEPPCEYPDCPTVCEPPNGCYDPGCPDGECPPVCYNCIIDNSSNINYRPISPGDINPNDRELGANWRIDDPITSALELKAQVTTQEIQNKGETIYDVSTNDEFAMEITLDSQMISKIRDYNESQKDNGGYANNTLVCYDHVDNKGVTYKNIYCYSTYLDTLIDDEITGPKIKIYGGERPRKEQDRIKSDESSYWKTWSTITTSELAMMQSSWTVDTEISLLTTQTNYGDFGIGPSWK